MSDHNTIFVGIDIAKFQFDVAFSHLSKGDTYDYTPSGIKKFMQKIQQLQPKLICLEATGPPKGGFLRASAREHS